MGRVPVCTGFTTSCGENSVCRAVGTVSPKGSQQQQQCLIVIVVWGMEVLQATPPSPLPLLPPALVPQQI